ncbi:MAG: hypothetical protein UI647_02760 [Negativibacillus sp.]
MKKILSTILSTLLCVSIIVFSPMSHCYADNNNPSDTESPVPTPFVDDHIPDDF